jgi:hypothetical protein
MLSWKELETEFRALRNSFRDARVDGQWGSAGEYWRVAGTSDRNAERRFLALANVAGEKLAGALTPGTQEAEEVLREGDPVRRWYKAIWKIGRNFEYGLIGEQKTDTGESAGFIYTGTINNIAEASSVFCLELLAQYPQDRNSLSEAQESEVKIKKGLWSRFYDSLNLKPGIWGISIDLKKLFRKVHK